MPGLIQREEPWIESLTMSLGVILRQRIPPKISNRGNEVMQVIVQIHGTVRDSGDE